MPVAILPDDVILTIIETCRHLERDREKTLAAMCRLSKRYKAAAERALYSRVEVRASSWQAHLVIPGTLLDTLVHEAKFRTLVKSVTLRIAEQHAHHPQLARLVRDLPNLNVISLSYGLTAAINQLLTQNIAHMQNPESDEAGLLLQTQSANSSANRLALSAIPLPASTIPPSRTVVTSLSVAHLRDPDIFATFTSAFCSTLTHLCLPLRVGLGDHSLVNLRNLRHLSLVNERLEVDDFVEAILHVESILASTGSSTTFISIAFEGVLVAEERDSSPPTRALYGWPAPRLLIPATASQVPASSRYVLAAIPSQIQHVSLSTSFFVADDVATYVLGTLRPLALNTLRVGGAIGQGFKEFARTRRAWYADFERTMERAGIEVTAME
ncbi:hypothetical protein JCM10449v2_006339 [Rhodotorula kratochvilovae]